MNNISINEQYYPAYVALEITRKCNMKCLHCGSTADENERDSTLSFDEWCKIITDLIKMGTECIFLSGGEPLLYPKWKDMIKFIAEQSLSDKPVEIGIITNGWLLTKENVEFIKKYNIHCIGISLDGDEQIHDYIRQTSGSFKRVLDNIKICLENDVDVSIITSINKLNYQIRNTLADIVFNAGVKNWQVQIVNAFGRAGAQKDTMLIDHQQYIQFIDDIKIWQEKFGDKMTVSPADSIGYCHPDTDLLLGDYEWNGCNAGLFVLGIESNGNVKGCLSLQDDYFIAGNTRNRNIIDIWNDDNSFPYTRKYDSDKMSGSCKGCSVKEKCKAGCLGMAFSIHRTIYENAYCYKMIREQDFKENR